MSPRQTLPQPSPGISRVDQKSTRTHGYVGRLGYRQTETGWRPAHKAFFGDASHGGPAGALKAAEAWLKQVRRKLAAEEKAGTARSSRRPAARKAGARGAGAKKAATRKSGAVRVAARKRKAAASAR